MPKVEMSVPHQLGTAEAERRIKGIIEKLKDEHGDQVSELTERWNGPVGTFSMKAMGFTVSGTITVRDSSVDMTANVPMMAMMFKGQIEEMVRERAATLLA